MQCHSYSSGLPYGGKLWRVQILAKWQGKHHWWNKLWQIDDKSLIKRILKQFEDTSCTYFEYTRACAACKLCQMAVVVFSRIYDYRLPCMSIS